MLPGRQLKINDIRPQKSGRSLDQLGGGENFSQAAGE
jgi:hypothetical protein